MGIMTNINEMISFLSHITIHLIMYVNFEKCNDTTQSDLICRICVEAALPPNAALQIDCYCNKALDHRQTMHVQGLSHWAPANIGPYSQCVQVYINKQCMFRAFLIWHQHIGPYSLCAQVYKQTMHVQGLSHWAPPNTGPHSQCVQGLSYLKVPFNTELCSQYVKVRYIQ
jgi:hypothetical protein